MSVDTRVEWSECRCPGTPHPAGDYVVLRERPDTAMRFALLHAISDAGDDPHLLTGFMFAVYLRLGPVEWNVANGTGKPLAITDLADHLGVDRAMAVADRATELYTEAITGPLVPSASSSPAATPPEPSTSPPSETSSSSEPSSPSGPEPSESLMLTGV